MANDALRRENASEVVPRPATICRSQRSIRGRSARGLSRLRCAAYRQWDGIELNETPCWLTDKTVEFGRALLRKDRRQGENSPVSPNPGIAIPTPRRRRINGWIRTLPDAAYWQLVSFNIRDSVAATCPTAAWDVLSL